MQVAQRPVDIKFPQVGPVDILGCPLSGSRVAANPNVMIDRKGPSLLVAAAPNGQNAAIDLMAVESPEQPILHCTQRSASDIASKNATKAECVLLGRFAN